MITNATAVKFGYSLADATGQVQTFLRDTQFSVRIFVDNIQNSQKWTLGATIKDAELVAYFPKDPLNLIDEDPPEIGDLLVATIDGEDQKTWEIVSIKDRVLNSLSHYELFLKPVP